MSPEFCVEGDNVEGRRDGVDRALIDPLFSVQIEAYPAFSLVEHGLVEELPSDIDRDKAHEKGYAEEAADYL